jgi:toxin CcdB
MSRFDVFRAKNSPLLLLDLQSGILDILPTRIVAPLLLIEEMPWAIGKLNPRFEIDGDTYALATQRMAAIQLNEIGVFVVNLSRHSDEITAATDFLFQGF